MNITQIATSPGGALQPATGVWPITERIAAVPRALFRQVLYLRIVVGAADRVVLEAEQVTLTGTFAAYEYDALGADAPPRPEPVRASGGVLIVALDVPRQIKRVQLAANSVPGEGYSLEFYRLDGDVLSSKPTITVAASAQTDAATPSDAFVDARLALRLKKNSDNTPVPLVANTLTELQVISYPTGPRIGLAPPDDPAAAVFFWQAPGEIKGDVLGTGVVDSGGTLAEALQRYLDRVRAEQIEALADPSAPLPEHIDVALVIQSDSPCTFALTGFTLPYHLVQESFPDRQMQKHVLRFTDDRIRAQSIPLALPGNAVVQSATLRVAESLRDSKPLAGNGTAPLDAALTQRVGAHVDTERRVAQWMTPSQALAVGGISLGVLALTAETELSVEVHEDWQDQPSGKKLVAGVIPLERVGRAEWVRFMFPTSIVLATQPYWLLVSTTRGRAVWLLETGPAPARVLEAVGQTSAWRVIRSFDGLEALYQLFAVGGSAQQSTHTSDALAVRVDGVMAPRTLDDPCLFDLTAAVNTYLGSRPAAATQVAMPVTCTAVLSGIVTVYPPRIVYTLA